MIIRFRKLFILQHFASKHQLDVLDPLVLFAEPDGVAAGDSEGSSTKSLFPANFSAADRS
jgi:hypothetical protein